MKVGLDTVEIARIEKSFEINSFFEKVYSPAERDFLGKKKNPYPSAAANFAAKEAFAKALGTGIVGFSLDEVSVLRDNNGAPYLELYGRAKELARGYKFTVSLTHTSTLASAIVIAYKDE